MISVNFKKMVLLVSISAICCLTGCGSPQKCDAKESATALETIHQRTSIRKYSDQKVTKEQLTTLLKAAMAAPSGLNKQPWFFVVATDKKILETLAEASPNAKMLSEASAAIIVCGNMNLAAEGVGQLMWVMDCSAASQNILLAATSMGLGAVWTGVYPSEQRMGAVSAALNLPEHIIPLNVIPIGYPATDQDVTPKDKWDESKVSWATLQ